MTDYLTTAQAAAALKVTDAHVRRLCGRNKLPGAQLWGRDWRIPAQAVADYQANGHKPGRPPTGRARPAREE